MIKKPLVLTDREKKALKSLYEKPGFKVIEKIAEDMELRTFNLFKNVDYKDEKSIQILAKNTYYIRGMEDLLQTIKTQTNCVSERSDDKEEDK